MYGSEHCGSRTSSHSLHCYRSVISLSLYDTVMLTMPIMCVCVCKIIDKASPMLDHSLSEVIAVVGEPITLPCVLVDGAPLPEIIWTRNGQKVGEHSNTLSTSCWCVCGRVGLGCV